MASKCAERGEFLMNDNLLSTKFIFAIVVTAMGFVLTLTKQCTVEQWFNFVEIVGGIYVTGNVISKFSPETKAEIKNP